VQINNLYLFEIGSAVFSIVYSLLLMFEKKLGWYFGIASSILGAILFYYTKIYAQSLISIYYAGVGFYGLWYWNKAEKTNEHIKIWKAINHIYAILILSVVSYFIAVLFMKYTDSTSPLLDSFITVFGLLASIKEARKILSSWIYWFVINALSVILFYQQGLYYYAVLMVVYALLCIGGYSNWLRIYRKYSNTINN